MGRAPASRRRPTAEMSFAQMLVHLCGWLFGVFLLILSAAGMGEGLVNNNPGQVVWTFLLCIVILGALLLDAFQKLLWRRGATLNQVLAAAAIALVAVSVTGLVLGQRVKAKPKLSGEYWAAVAQVCQGKAIADAAPLSSASRPHRIVAVAEGKEVWYDRMPAEWLPESIGTTELVVCLGEKEERILEVCRYIQWSDITRYGYGRTIRLMAAQTGDLIATSTFSGSPPRECRGQELPSVKTLRGDDVQFYQVETWLSPFVEP